MEEERTTLSGGASPLTGDRPASPSAASNERVTATIENWKRKLLDLSKRNRALNFKMSKVATIAIVDEQPAEVFRHLYLRERPMRFKAAPEADEQLSLIDKNASLTIHTGETLVDQSGTSQGGFLCGIECDGVAYHESETARDRDRLRQQVLEARGWTIHRVWSTDWFKDRQGQIERLISLIEEDRARAQEEAAADRQARERLAREAEASAAEDAERIKQEIAEIRSTALDSEPYERPFAAPYVKTPGEGKYATSNFYAVTLGDLVKLIVLVVETEFPIHRFDVLTRVAGMWGMRLGSRIQGRILQACESAEGGGAVRLRGDFYWSVSSGGKCIVRSRAGTRIPGDRIAPEEYHEAILAVLAKGHAFSRSQLVNEVRSVFGFSRTGAILEEAINSEIDALLGTGKLGEGSTGIRRRV